MEFEKYTVKGGIQQLPDRPKDSAAELKAKFDEAEKNIGEYINEKLIPKLEEMKKYSNEAFRHAGSVDPRDIPTLTVEDKGRVYNIGNSGTLKYTITYDGVVSENSFSNYLYLTGSYDGIEDEYLRSLKKIQIVSEDCSSYAHWGFTDGQETVFHLEAENGHYKEFKSGSEVTVSIEAELPLQFGDNIVWDGYYWDKLSCDVVDYVSENVSAPVQSGAVYNAIKEHADNTEDFHGLPLTKGSGENSLQQKNTQANGKASFSEGMGTIASGDCSHSAGHKTRAQGMYSFAQGLRSEARGHRSCAQGYHTVAQGENQHARGKFNIIDNENKYADIVGNGTSDEDRSNAYTLDWDGNVEFAGDVKSKGNTLESTANKITAIDENSTDEQYPSAKAVFAFGSGMGNDLLQELQTYYAQKLYVDEACEKKVDKYYKQLFPTLTITEEDITNAGEGGITQLVVGDDNSSILETVNELYIYMYIPASKDINSANSPLHVVLANSTTEAFNQNKAILYSQSPSYAPLDYSSTTNYVIKSVFVNEDKTLMYTEYMRNGFGASSYPQNALATVPKSNDNKKSLIGSKAIIINAFQNNVYFKFPKDTTVTVYGR